MEGSIPKFIGNMVSLMYLYVKKIFIFFYINGNY